MNTEMLLKEFRTILTYEERAKHFYEHLIEQVKDEDIIKKLTDIRDDEIIHIGIARKLIEYVS
jgi:rubrerythrin